MAPSTRYMLRRAAPAVEQQDDSDYGSEIDENAVSELLTRADSQVNDSQDLESFSPLILESLEEPDSLRRSVHVPKSSPSDPAQSQSGRCYTSDATLDTTLSVEAAADSSGPNEVHNSEDSRPTISCKLSPLGTLSLLRL